MAGIVLESGQPRGARLARRSGNGDDAGAAGHGVTRQDTSESRHQSWALPLDTYSIQLRLQRTTTEHCFVSVPVTSDIVDQQVDGTKRINPGKMTAMAIQMALSCDVRWHAEGIVVQPHPIQRPKEPGE